MSDQVYYVFTPNPQFTGTRNAGRHSTEFIKGVAKVTSEETAKILRSNFGYLCPDLDEGDLDAVYRIHGKQRVEALLSHLDAVQALDDFGDVEQRKSAQDAQEPGNGKTDPDEEPDEQPADPDGKVEVEFIKKHGINKPESRGRFKPETAAKYVNEGIAKYTGN